MHSHRLREAAFQRTRHIQHHAIGFQPAPLGHRVQLLKGVDGIRVCRVAEKGDAGHAGHELAQQFQPLRLKLVILRREPGDVAAGSRQVGDGADPDRIGDRAHDDRDRPGSTFRGEHCGRAPGQDYIGGQSRQLGGERGIAVVVTARPARLEPNVLPLGPAAPVQFRLEAVDRAQRRRREQPDHLRRLGGPRRRSEHDRAQCRGQIAPPHSMISSVRARIAGGIARPSAFAVLRLSSSSNRVGWTTGRSAGLVPCSTFPA